VRVGLGWLRNLPPFGMPGELVGGATSRIPPRIPRVGSSALHTGSGDSEGLDGLWMPPSRTGRSLPGEGKPGAVALSGTLHETGASGGVCALVARWYRILLEVGDGI
jgi:hypothetical protein